MRILFFIIATMPSIIVGCTPTGPEPGIAANDEDRQSTTSRFSQIPGTIRLNFSRPVTLNNVELSLITFPDGRPSVIQVANYDVRADLHHYPAVLFHGASTATKIPELAGQTIDCDMYYQNSELSMIAMTQPGESVQLTFTSDGNLRKSVSASLGSADLISADDQIIPLNGGQISAVIRELSP